MSLWLSENIGTIAVSLVLILIVALIIKGMIRDKKQGKNSCGCKCSHCPMSCSCRVTRGTVRMRPGEGRRELSAMSRMENRGRKQISGTLRISQ